MTTYVTFVPSNQQAFQFQATLDNNLYTCQVTWNLFGQGYYINLYDVNNNLILCRQMTASGIQINATLSWANSVALATLTAPHNIPIGRSCTLIVSGTGTAYDGTWPSLSTGTQTATFALANNPQVTGNGYVSQDVDLVAGYFNSSLVFRSASQQFEISP